jgi:hypothetical protein
MKHIQILEEKSYEKIMQYFQNVRFMQIFGSYIEKEGRLVIFGKYGNDVIEILVFLTLAICNVTCKKALQVITFHVTRV